MKKYPFVLASLLAVGGVGLLLAGNVLGNANASGSLTDRAGIASHAEGRSLAYSDRTVPYSSGGQWDRDTARLDCNRNGLSPLCSLSRTGAPYSDRAGGYATQTT